MISGLGSIHEHQSKRKHEDRKRVTLPRRIGYGDLFSHINLTNEQKCRILQNYSCSEFVWFAFSERGGGGHRKRWNHNTYVSWSVKSVYSVRPPGLRSVYG